MPSKQVKKSLLKKPATKSVRKAEKPAPKPIPKPSMPKPTPKTPLAEYFYANGKRKTAVSRVRLLKGKGAITVNDRTFENYFPVAYHQQIIRSPLKLTSQDGQFDIIAKVFGGGINAQAEAIRHGVSKALLDFDPGLRLTLKRAGFLTRDSRVKERKKPGLHRARRAPQFSKR